ncbi:uncharacterized protein ARMOST_07999 [Armillaria ostoyae]|uniref:Uncharacterized protein n=1 Tax=Armillaria ostoyae TaxID=47428 RepID=A0A284R7C6_ARMOS|nr:uncharacterized protein ARMOST_07999 [Armillaria ostoyae]
MNAKAIPAAVPTTGAIILTRLEGSVPKVGTAVAKKEGTVPSAIHAQSEPPSTKNAEELTTVVVVDRDACKMYHPSGTLTGFQEKEWTDMDMVANFEIRSLLATVNDMDPKSVKVLHSKVVSLHTVVFAGFLNVRGVISPSSPLLLRLPSLHHDTLL